jgi:hypothetical protein
MDNLKLAAVVREIGAVAPKVAKEHAEQQAAFNAELDAETKLLESVIEMAKPALPAICNGIGASATAFLMWEGQTQNELPLRLYILASGELVEAWDYFHDELNQVVGTQHPREPRFVAQKYEVSDLIATLHSAIVKQNGKRVPSTETAKQETERLRAILTLLG